MSRKPRNLQALATAFGLALATFAVSAPAHAANWHFGLGVGYGGSGITTVADTASGTPAVNRADGPIVAEIYVDHFVSETFMLTLSHARGISAAPFSSGEGFTGLTGSYYFLGPPSQIAAESSTETTLSVHRWTPFVGLSVGYASASISRDNIYVPTATGSGVYMGFRAGLDYPTGPSSGWRPEFVYGSTSFTQSLSSKDSTPPPTLEHFSLQFSWYFGF